MINAWNYKFIDNMYIENNYDLAIYNHNYLKTLSPTQQACHIIPLREMLISLRKHFHHIKNKNSDNIIIKLYIYIIYYLLYIYIYNTRYDITLDVSVKESVQSRVLITLDNIIKIDYCFNQYISDKDMYNFLEIRYLITGDKLCLYNKCRRTYIGTTSLLCSIHTRQLCIRAKQIEAITNITLDVSKIIVEYSSF
jgi:hypothetical protein